MNKLLTKIVGLSLGLSMAIGVGVAVGMDKRDAVQVSAADSTTKYELINSTSSLEAGKSYIITNGTSGTVKAISTETNSNNRKTTDATVSSGKITRGSSVMSFTLGGSSGSWTFKCENYTTSGDLYLASAASGKNNYLRCISTAGTATISFSDDAAVINIGPHTERTLVRYNPNNGNPMFACYSSGQQAVYLWKEVAETTDPTIDLSETELTIAKDSTNTFTVDAANLTGQLTVTSGDSSKVTVDSISPAPANPTEDGTYTVTLGGAAVTTSAVTITVASAADSLSKTLAASVEQIVEYPQITDGMTNGTYVLYYSGKAMNTTVTNNRLQYEEVTLSSNKIQDPADNIIWKVRKASAGLYTLYNADAGAYAIGTSTKNQAITGDGSSMTNYYYWSVEDSTTTFEFINKGRAEGSSDTGNKYLRNNGTNGFACYASGTGGALSLYGFHEDVLTTNKNTVTIDKGSNTTVTLGVTNPTGTATYSASSSDTSVATVNVSGTTLTINGVGVGTTTVTASLLIDSVAVDFVEIEVTVNSSVALDEIIIKADGTEVAGQTVHLSQGNNLSLSYYALDTEGEEWEGDVTYSISSTTYATLSGSTVTASTSTYGGSTTITVTADDYPTKTSSFTLVVDQWTGVLTIGSTYVLATVSSYTDHPSTLTSLPTTTSSAYGSVTENVAYLSTDVELVVESGNTYNSYSFKIDDTYYLSGNGANTTLYKSSVKNDNSSWTVSLSDGVYTITNVGTPARFLSYNYANGSPRIACYAAVQTANVRLVEVTPLVALQGRTEDFCQKYMHPEIAIDDEEDTGKCRGESGYFYTAKEALEKAPSSGGYSDCIEQFAASGNMWNRYVAWGEAVGYSVEYSNSEISYSNVAFNNLINIDENNAIVIIVSVSLIGLTTIGGYFFIRKRKEQI